MGQGSRNRKGVSPDIWEYFFNYNYTTHKHDKCKDGQPSEVYKWYKGRPIVFNTKCTYTQINEKSKKQLPRFFLVTFTLASFELISFDLTCEARLFTIRSARSLTTWRIWTASYPRGAVSCHAKVFLPSSPTSTILFSISMAF